LTLNCIRREKLNTETRLLAERHVTIQTGGGAARTQKQTGQRKTANQSFQKTLRPSMETFWSFHHH
jgi:hypothetical protein